MNKLLFRLLVILMTLSLIGIIAVQIYWFKTSFSQGREQFVYNVQQALVNVGKKIEKQEAYSFINRYNHFRDSTGKMPQKEDLLEFSYIQKNKKTNKTIIYSNSITSDSYEMPLSLYGKNKKSTETELFKNFNTKRTTEIVENRDIENSIIKEPLHHFSSVTIEKKGGLQILDDVQFEIFFKDIAQTKPIEERISKELLSGLLNKELKTFGLTTKFEFEVYNEDKPTEVKSENFIYKKNRTYSIPILPDNEGATNYKLFISFPHQKQFILSELLLISILSIIFTLIIVVAYYSAISQLIRQRQISEIKADFINNMTHEFKTPIATINLALEAIRNPKVIENKEAVFKYLEMIRDENKRMHAQVENVLRISKLEKKELDIPKEQYNIHEVIDDAIEHVSLILEDRNGTINCKYDALRTTVLINEVHFVNVIVNILENAVKYSLEHPSIEVSTQNIKDFILIRVRDYGVGMSKVAQKKVFEMFYREHTGDLHNVKGHGLGLAYVKRIVEDHNGQIYVESEKGKGSTFTIKLPLIN